jgi:hypothetical protein
MLPKCFLFCSFKLGPCLHYLLGIVAVIQFTVRESGALRGKKIRVGLWYLLDGVANQSL